MSSRGAKRQRTGVNTGRKVEEPTKVDSSSSDEEEDAVATTSTAPKTPFAFNGRDTSKRVIVVLERAGLETVKTKKGYALLNADDHHSIHRKLKRDPGQSRPDIVHQALLTLLDSPLNKAGLLQVFIHTDRNVLIEVSPHIRIPRTYKRFAGLMVQLLHKMKIRAAQSSKTLLKVVRNPVSAHLPPGCRKIGTSVQGKLVRADDFVATLPDEPIVFCYGSHAHGPVEVDYVEEVISLSQYPLSAACALGRILNAFEKKWDIV